MLKNLAGILDTKDAEILSDALWAWGNLAESENIPLPELLEKFPAKNIPFLLCSESQSLVGSTLRFIGNVCSTSDPIITTFMSDDILKCFIKILTIKVNSDIIKECCLIIHNYAIGPSIHAEKLVSLGITDSLCNILTVSNNNSVLLLNIIG